MAADQITASLLSQGRCHLHQVHQSKKDSRDFSSTCPEIGRENAVSKSGGIGILRPQPGLYDRTSDYKNLSDGRSPGRRYRRNKAHSVFWKDSCLSGGRISLPKKRAVAHRCCRRNQADQVVELNCPVAGVDQDGLGTAAVLLVPESSIGVKAPTGGKKLWRSPQKTVS